MTDDDLREIFAERAAIREYDGGQDRALARDRIEADSPLFAMGSVSE